MTYDFECSKCGLLREVVRPYKEAGRAEGCSCGHPMDRVWSVPQVSIKSHGYFNNGLGQYVRHAGDVKDALNRHKDTTGREMVEIGNESAKVAKKDPWTFTNTEMKQMHNELGGD